MILIQQWNLVISGVQSLKLIGGLWTKFSSIITFCCTLSLLFHCLLWVNALISYKLRFHMGWVYWDKYYGLVRWIQTVLYCKIWGLMIIIFWEMTPCGSYKNRCFEGSYRLHLQGERVRAGTERSSKLLYRQRLVEYCAVLVIADKMSFCILIIERNLNKNVLILLEEKYNSEFNSKDHERLAYIFLLWISGSKQRSIMRSKKEVVWFRGTPFSFRFSLP
jgi:hypothetical protein